MKRILWNKLKKIFKVCLPEKYYTALVSIFKRNKNNQTTFPTNQNILSDQLIVCNLCGCIFKQSGPIHSEFLACPTCGSIARDRVVAQSIINELFKQSGEWHPILIQAKALEKFRLLECSPREFNWRSKVLGAKLGRYVTSDFDLSAHQGSIQLDLTQSKDVIPFSETFDIIICAHVLEHIPDYRMALANLFRMLAPGGFLVLQVPILEAQYTPVTWDEFHGDRTRVFHRFGFDLLEELNRIFTSARVVLGMTHFQITSSEISPEKYLYLQNSPDKVQLLGEDLLTFFGLGSPDLCDAFIAYKDIKEE